MRKKNRVAGLSLRFFLRNIFWILVSFCPFIFLFLLWSPIESAGDYIFVGIVSIGLVFFVINLIKTLILRANALKGNSNEIRVLNPKADLKVIKQIDDTYEPKRLRIRGEVNSKKVTLYLYPIIGGLKAFKEEEERINNSHSLTVKVFKNTNVIDNIPREAVIKKARKESKQYQLFGTNKTHKFKFIPVEYTIDDIRLLFTESSGLETIYVINDETYVIVEMFADSTGCDYLINGKKVKSFESVIDFLTSNGFIDDDKMKIVGSFDYNDPSLLALIISDLKSNHIDDY